MSGALFVELVLKVGLPMAKELYALWSAPTVTPEQIKRLDAIAEKEAKDYFERP